MVSAAAILARVLDDKYRIVESCDDNSDTKRGVTSLTHGGRPAGTVRLTLLVEASVKVECDDDDDKAARTLLSSLSSPSSNLPSPSEGRDLEIAARAADTFFDAQNAFLSFLVLSSSLPRRDDESDKPPSDEVDAADGFL